MTEIVGHRLRTLFIHLKGTVSGFSVEVTERTTESVTGGQEKTEDGIQ